MDRPTRLPRTVIALGVVSFFTDLSSEMIYPLLPLFLSGVLGAGALALGIIEGIAESAAALLKVVSGIWTDIRKRRKPFILSGYGLAGLARPLIGIASVWPFVLAMRLLDRVGKGLRTSPRDALIADVTVAEHRGKAYGFHRSMDHAGAVAGPLVAAGLLAIEGISLRQVFLLAAIPAVIVLLVIISAVHDPANSHDSRAGSTWRLGGQRAKLGSDFRILLMALFIFTLGNSTDAFLLLSLSQVGISAAWVAVLWSLHHVMKMISTYAGGTLSDRFGAKPMILSGWILYAAVYLAFGLSDAAMIKVALFLVYGIYFGLTEPAEKAWIAAMVPESVRGTGFGYYNAVLGLGALPSSLIFGLLWQRWGAATAFTTGAALAAGASLILLMIRTVPTPPRCETG
jgi:MFS family permease